jgi:ABC-type Zn uptake system ZnuABC Zn-binding protein ZnuA
MNVIAVESFLADIAQQVAGDRITIQTLIPLGLDPHSFEPTPQDVVRLTECDAVIMNGAGFEEWMGSLLSENLKDKPVIEAASGLTSRSPGTQELIDDHIHEGDPHFWLDPINVIKYTENIRDGLILLDQAGRTDYEKNAESYITQLRELDNWIQDQVSQIPLENRMIVTNHESFGYFADRYGFSIIGTIIPSVTTGASPSSQQLTQLVDQIRTTGVKVVFLETGANPQLADQLSRETGIQVVSNLYTHSITREDGNASSYLALMHWNTQQIVEVLK